MHENPRTHSTSSRWRTSTARAFPRWSSEAGGELLGTFILVFFGLGAVHVAVLTGGLVGLWQVAAVWGVAVGVAIYATAPLSGAHLNPAITVALTVFRGFPYRKIPTYVTAQVAGAFLAAAMLYSIFGGLVHRFEQAEGVVRGAAGSERSAMIYAEYFPNPGLLGTGEDAAASLTLFQAAVAEALGTAALAFVVFAATRKTDSRPPSTGVAALLIGLGLAMIIVVVAPLTQAGLNPARDFGPRLFSCLAGWGSIAIPGPRGAFFVVYILAPLCGALAGAGLHHVLVRATLTDPANIERREFAWMTIHEFKPDRPATDAPMERRLIIFTRYPEPGTTKTRLIPTLGAEGAAALQGDMTRHILGVARRLSADTSVVLEVRFEGGDAGKMEACFGSGPRYRPQGPGDLGCRMQRAFDEASSEGAGRVVIIGADCPGITAGLLKDALEQLSTADLVLGPASDGGYYLIGLRRGASGLFTDISWGSDRVLEETLCRARRLSLAVGRLKALSDVDRPEDLAVWHRVKRRPDSATAGQRISIVIPTLNEASYLPRTLANLQHARDVEVIVVDGGSDDGTPEIAERAGCRVPRSPPGRAWQLNAGAEVAGGELLLFLHADTRLPPTFDSAVRSTLHEPGVAAGAFRSRIDAPGWSLRLIERAVDIRSRLFQMPYGDQGIFVRAEVFRQVGGFPLLPIMDDFEFIRRVRRHGKIQTIRLAATTSGRRWQKLGRWRTTWINQKIILGYYLGISTERLAAWYRGDPKSTFLNFRGYLPPHNRPTRPGFAPPGRVSR